MQADMTECIVSTRSDTGIGTSSIDAGHSGRALGIYAALWPTARRTSYVVGYAGADCSAARNLALRIGSTR